MYEEKNKKWARGLLITVFAVLAIIILVVGIKVVIEHVDSKGNIKDDNDCLTEDAYELMRKSGSKIPTAAKCK